MLIRSGSRCSRRDGRIGTRQVAFRDTFLLFYLLQLLHSTGDGNPKSQRAHPCQSLTPLLERRRIRYALDHGIVAAKTL
jgi:hypothetical protein